MRWSQAIHYPHCAAALTTWQRIVQLNCRGKKRYRLGDCFLFGRKTRGLLPPEALDSIPAERQAAPADAAR